MSNSTQADQIWVRYDCDKCDDVLTVESNLVKHKHYRNGNVRYGCDQCNGSIMSKGNLAHHKNSKHEGIRFDCDQCDGNLHNR